MQYKKQVICCVAVLLASLCAVQMISQKLTLHQRLALGLVKPDVISVSMPLPETMSETDAGYAFEKLTSGFEKQYPGFGIDLKIYTEASAVPEDSDMHLNAETPFPEQADLSEIYRELDMQNYLEDISAEKYSVPLSFRVPVLYYDMTDMNLFQQFGGKESVEIKNLPENTFRDSADDERFQAFLNNPEFPVLDDSSRIRLTEQNPASSGRIHMIPVTVNGSYQKEYRNLCEINAQSDKNKQNTAMLWIEYLLSEEAQMILFAEHYGDLPLHESAFDTAVSQHQEFRILEAVKSERITEETSNE